MVGVERGSTRGLTKIAAVSLVAHALLITAALYFSKPSARFVLPQTYTVDLVTARPAPPAPPVPEAAPAEEPKPPAREATPAKAAAKRGAKKAAAPSARVKEVGLKVKAADPAAEAAKVKKAAEEAAKKEAASVDEALKRISERVKTKDDEALVARRVEELAKKTSARKAAAAPAAPSAKPEKPQKAAGVQKAAGRDAEVKYPAYLAMVRDRVQREWKYPAELKDNKLTVIVAVTIARDGSLESARVERSSGNAAFDESLVNAVLKAAPFPPLPEGFDGDRLETGLRFCGDC